MIIRNIYLIKERQIVSESFQLFPWLPPITGQSEALLYLPTGTPCC